MFCTALVAGGDIAPEDMPVAQSAGYTAWVKVGADRVGGTVDVTALVVLSENV